jgi:hypothetical protein
MNDNNIGDVDTVISQETISFMVTLSNMMNIMEQQHYELDLQLALELSEHDNELKRNNDIVIELDWVIYDESKSKYDTCSICLENFKNDEYVAILDCEHTFHDNCIFEWGCYKQSCPICKKEIPYV